MQGIFRSFNNMDEICGQYRARGDKKLTGNQVSLFIPPKRFGGQSRCLAVECNLAEQDTNDRCDTEPMYLEAQKQLKKQKTTHTF